MDQVLRRGGAVVEYLLRNPGVSAAMLAEAQTPLLAAAGLAESLVGLDGAFRPPGRRRQIRGRGAALHGNPGVPAAMAHAARRAATRPAALILHMVLAGAAGIGAAVGAC